MATVTPNMSIYIPADGETNYGQSFLTGMQHVDAHDHTGGPNNGVVLGTNSIADGSITNAKLANSSVTVDGTAFTLGTPVVNPRWPSRTSFSAYISADQANATGDGTAFTIPFNLAFWNQGANLSNVGVYTAPVTGKYFFNFGVALGGLGAGHTSGAVTLLTTARTYTSDLSNYFAASVAGSLVVSGSFFADMTATDTARLIITVSGSTKTVAVLWGGAANTPGSIFQGQLMV